MKFQEVAEKAAAFQKEKQKLLDGLDEQKQLIVAKLENAETPEGSKKGLRAMMDMIEKQINGIRSELTNLIREEASAKTEQQQQASLSGFQLAEKERLDRELDMLATAKASPTLAADDAANAPSEVFFICGWTPFLPPL